MQNTQEIKVIAAKLLIVEDKIKSATAADDPELIERWRALVEELLVCLNPEQNARRNLRIPLHAVVKLHVPATGSTIDVECWDLSWTGFGVTGNLAAHFRESSSADLMAVVHRGRSFSVGTPCRLTWCSDGGSLTSRRAGFALEGPFSEEFRTLYLDAYERFMNKLASGGVASA